MADEIRMKNSLTEESRSYALIDDTPLLHAISVDLDIFDMYSDFTGEPICLATYMFPASEQGMPIATVYGVPLAKWKPFKEYVENLLITHNGKKYAPYIMKATMPDINTRGNKYPFKELVTVYVISAINATDNKILKQLQTQSDKGIEFGWDDYKEDDNKKKRRRSHISSHMRFEIFQRDGFKCHYCGIHKDGLPNGVKLTLDHKRPYSDGGDDSFANLITACSECNHGKSNKVVNFDDSI
jgi:hypothetical protein